MAVRVRLRVEGPRSAVETSGLVNSGYEALTPQLLLPRRLAERIGLYPLPESARVVEMDSPGGPLRLVLVPRGVRVSLLAGDRVVGPVAADAVISDIEDEVLISDKLAEELGIVLIAIASGIWRLADDPPDTRRESVEPEYW